MIPQELKNNPPRNIQYTDKLFSKNRKRVKIIIIGSPFIILFTALIWWLKFSDVMTGVYVGIITMLFGELIGFALMLNNKRIVAICQNGILVIGKIVKVSIRGNAADYTTDSPTTYMLTVTYKEKSGRELTGMISFPGSVRIKKDDEVSVLYLNEKPEQFIIYIDNVGISTTIGRKAK